MGNSRAGAAAALSAGERSLTRTGGTRTTSPAATRVSAAARPLFTRTSPLRMMRYTWVLGTPFRCRIRKLSSRWPALSASTVSQPTSGLP